MTKSKVSIRMQDATEIEPEKYSTNNWSWEFILLCSIFYEQNSLKLMIQREIHNRKTLIHWLNTIGDILISNTVIYIYICIYIYSVQFIHSVVSDCLQSHGPQHTRPLCSSPAPRVHPNPCPSSWWCPPAISSSVFPLLFLPSIFPSIRVFSNESALRIRWPKYWSLSFISPANEHPGLISFRMDWLDLLAVQGTLLSLLQHHSSKASILLCSAFFMIQLSHPYMTTGKTIALTRWTY